MSVDTRLATYGTLAPGQPNHHQLSAICGHWQSGQVHGHLIEEGWGAKLGYPALVVDPDAPAVEVQLFESSDLPAHWSRLDAFEGSGYQRVAIPVEVLGGTVDAWIYVAAAADPHPSSNP